MKGKIIIEFNGTTEQADRLITSIRNNYATGEIALRKESREFEATFKVTLVESLNNLSVDNVGDALREAFDIGLAKWAKGTEARLTHLEEIE